MAYVQGWFGCSFVASAWLTDPFGSVSTVEQSHMVDHLLHTLPSHKVVGLICSLPAIIHCDYQLISSTQLKSFNSQPTSPYHN
jgi:hypothetical protein